MFGDKRNRQNLIDFYLEFYDVYWIRSNFIALKSAIKFRLPYKNHLEAY